MKDVDSAETVGQNPVFLDGSSMNLGKTMFTQEGFDAHVIAKHKLDRDSHSRSREFDASMDLAIEAIDVGRGHHPLSPAPTTVARYLREPSPQSMFQLPDEWVESVDAGVADREAGERLRRKELELHQQRIRRYEGHI